MSRFRPISFLRTGAHHRILLRLVHRLPIRLINRRRDGRVGECAGVTIDLIQTLIFEAEEALGSANEALVEKRFGDACYHAYNGRIRAAKALLTSVDAKTNSHASIIASFDTYFPAFKTEQSRSFSEGIADFRNTQSDEAFANTFLEETKKTIQWIKNSRNATVE